MGVWDWIRGALGGKPAAPEAPVDSAEPNEAPVASALSESATEPVPKKIKGASPLKEKAGKRRSRVQRGPKKPKKPNKGRSKGLMAEGSTRRERPATPRTPTSPVKPAEANLLPTPKAEIEPIPGFSAPPAPTPESPAPEPSPPAKVAAAPSTTSSAPASPVEVPSEAPRRQHDQETVAWIVVPKLEDLLTEVDEVLGQAEAPREALVRAQTRFVREWQSLRPIPRDEVERLQAEHARRVEVLKERIRALPDPKAEEEARNVEAREALIAEGEGLVAHPDLKEAIAKAKEMQRRWRDAPRVAKSTAQAQTRRFRAAMDAVFARREADRAERLARLSAFVTSAEALTRAQDPVRAAEAMKQLQAQWKETGGVRGEEGDALWTRFRAAADQVFESRRSTKQAQEAANLQARQDLIAEAEALAADAVDDPDATVRGLQRRWKRIGHVPREMSDSLWNAFREACDRIRNPPRVDPSDLGDGQDALRFSPFAGIRDSGG